MFTIKNRYSTSKFNVDVLELLEPFIDLSKVILNESKKEISLIDIVDFSNIDINFLKAVTEIRAKIKILKKETRKSRNNPVKIEEYTKTIEEYEGYKLKSHSIFSNYILSECLNENNLKKISTSNVLFIIKSEKIILSFDEKNREIIKALVSKFGIIKNYQASLNKGHLSKSTVYFNKFEKPAFYNSGNWISTDELDLIYCPIIEFDFIDKNLVELDYCEGSDIWVNEKFLKKQFKIELTSDTYQFVRNKESNKLIGFKIDNYFFSTISDIKPIIYKERIVDFYWLLISRNIYRQQSITVKPLSLQINNFNLATKKESFINTLSYLEKNLYLQNRTIDEEFASFFDSVISVNELDYVNGFEFYLPNIDTQEKSILGIYKEQKAGEKHYNLVHWINNKDGSMINHFHKEVPIEKKKKALNALKPEISFYFRSKFFEDYVYSIFEDLGLKFTSNYHVLLKDGTPFEIDFLINVGNDIYIVETKTKMSSQYIEEFEKKSEKFLSELKDFEGSIKFLLISAFSDDNCELYKYYIEHSRTEELNTRRAGLFTKTYCFDIPIHSASDKKITCISEPVYDNLKKIIFDICQ